MDQASKERFDELVAKDPASLTEHEVAFLRARESYLDEEQRANFAAVLGLKTQEDDEDKDTGKPLEELSYRELKKLAKSLDIDPSDFDEVDQLIAAIREKQTAQ